MSGEASVRDRVRTGSGWLVVALVALASFSACGSDDDVAASPLLRLPVLHAEADPVGGGRIIDAEGREVLLRGVNVNALAEYWQYGEIPPTIPFDRDDAAVMNGIGVRLR